MKNKKAQVSELLNSVGFIVIAIIFFILGTIMIQGLVDSDSSEDEKIYTLNSNLTDPIDFLFVADADDCPLIVQRTNSDGDINNEDFSCVSSGFWPLTTYDVSVNATNITNNNNEIKLRFTV